MIERGVAVVALVTAAVLGLLFGILIGVGIAKAAPFTPELEADYAFAEQWWGAVPVGCSSVAREVVPSAELGGNAGAASRPTPGAPPAPCVIRIAEGQPSSCYQRETVLHEYGHLLGYGHSEDSSNIMYPEGDGACERAFVIAQLRRGLKRINARCQAKTTRLQLRLCRHTEHEYRQMLAAELDRVQEP